MSRSARVFAKLRLSSYLLFFCDTQRENPSNLSKNQCVFPLYCHGIRVSFFTPSWWTETNKSAPRSLARARLLPRCRDLGRARACADATRKFTVGLPVPQSFSSAARGTDRAAAAIAS